MSILWCERCKSFSRLHVGIRSMLIRLEQYKRHGFVKKVADQGKNDIVVWSTTVLVGWHAYTAGIFLLVRYTRASITNACNLLCTCDWGKKKDIKCTHGILWASKTCSLSAGAIYFRSDSTTWPPTQGYQSKWYRMSTTHSASTSKATRNGGRQKEYLRLPYLP